MSNMRYGQNQPWPKHDIDTLRELRAAGKGATEIATALRRTVSAVGAKIRALKLPNMPAKPAPPRGPLEQRRNHAKLAEPTRAGKTTLPPLPSLADYEPC